MKLVAEGLNVNGKVSLLIRAFDDLGQRLPFTDKCRDLTSLRERDRIAAGLVRELDVSEEAARAAVKQLLLEVEREATGALASSPAAASNLPEIVIAGRQLREIERDCWAVLQNANDEEGTRFAHRGGLLYEIVTSPDLHLARPRLLRVAGLRGVLAERADFVHFKGPVFPPPAIFEDLLEASEPPVPELRGVMASPLVVQSGEVVMSPGYHAASGYYVTRGPELAPIPARPSGEDLRAARALLDELIGEFPFVSQADRTHAIGAMLTRAARTLTNGPTPLHDIEASTEGSGKGLFADVVSLVTTGRLPRTLTQGRDEDEWRKRITAALVEAAPITLIDNVHRRLDSTQVSAVLTAREWSDRPMGVTRVVTLPVETVWLMTANNPAFSNEIARRLVRVRIDPAVERPWLRKDFRHPDLRQWSLENRGPLLHALLVLVRAWQVEGCPEPAIILGSFESWTSVVGGILKVAGYEDFLGNREEVYEEGGRQLDEWRALLAAWWAEWQSKSVSVTQLHALAVERGLLPGLRAGVNQHAAVVKMGLALADMRDRVIGEWRLHRAGQDSSSRQTYALSRMEGRENTSEVLRTLPANGGLGGLGGTFAGMDTPADAYDLDEGIGAEMDAEAAALADDEAE